MTRIGTLYALVSAWEFVWPRAWIGMVRGNRVPGTKRRGKWRYYVARILRVPLEGVTSGIAREMWGKCCGDSSVLAHCIHELIRWFIYKQMYLNEKRGG